MTPIAIITIILAFVAFFVIINGIKVVKQSRCMIVERLGRYNGTFVSGLNVLIPFIDRPRDMYWIFNGVIAPTTRIDLRETVLDVPEQAVITKDNVSINIDALLYIQITDPQKAVYEISNLPMHAINRQ